MSVDTPYPQRRPQLPVAQLRPALFAATRTELSRGRFPGRGLLYSLLIHETMVFAMLIGPPVSNLAQRGPRPVMESFTKIAIKEVVYLPQLGGGSSGEGGPSGDAKAMPARTHAGSTVTRGRAGASFPGTQFVVSNPPRPDNRIQTIFQPELVSPPALKVPLPLPNMLVLPNMPQLPGPTESVKAVAKSELRSGGPQSPAELPNFSPLPAPPLELARLSVPPARPPSPISASVAASATSSNNPNVSAIPPPQASEPRLEPPSAKLAAVGSQGIVDPLPVPPRPELRTLLIVSPIAGQAEPLAEIPAGEARGQFVLSPPELSTSASEPGSAAPAAASPGRIGFGNEANAVDTLGGNSAGTLAAGKTGVASTPGEGGRGGGGVGSRTGRDAGAGSGSGSGPRLGTGSGTGAGGGPGRGAFPGITIEGGGWTPGPLLKTATRIPQQSSYGLTIVSTGNSGGGLGDFGVFRDETVFTVYIDMRHSNDDPAPSWTLQFASLDRTARAQGVLQPPFPLVKGIPPLEAEVVCRYQGRVVVVYAIINAHGKVQNMHIMQSPNIRLNPPLLEALKQWIFRPAEINGQPVPVKALLGIPLAWTR